jgi:hypothetical protein
MVQQNSADRDIFVASNMTTSVFRIANNGDVLINGAGVYKKYNRVVFYNNNDPYAKRLHTCLQQINNEYFILIHDIDIVLNTDDFKLKKLIDCLKINNLDKIDLKYPTDSLKRESLDTRKIYKINDFNDFTTWVPKQTTEEIDDSSTYLIVINEPGDYIYNVNPSIWKKAALYDIVNTFQYRTYRDIENIDVQNFCKKLKTLSLYTKKIINAGYYNCVDLFKFLHITHGGKLLELNSTSTTRYGQSYASVREDYIKIIDKYNLRLSDKWVDYGE